MKKKRLPVCLLCLALFFSYHSGAEETPPAATPVPVSASSLFREGGLLCVVNKESLLSKHYEPQDLRQPQAETRKKSLQDNILLREAAALKLEEMLRAADVEMGYILYAVSGYRSFGIQQINFSTKLASVGGSKDKAMRTVAPPGASEHQLGLAMDIQSENFHNLNPLFGETPEGIWLMDNAHRFGFILRYKAEWRDITGFAYEPWHFRYVGLAHAAAMHTLDIPLETYANYLSQLPEYAVKEVPDVLLSGLVGEMMAGDKSSVHFLHSAAPQEREPMLRRLAEKYLPDGMTYEHAFWASYPTPRPTSAPRIDTDTEIELFGSGGS